MSWTVVEHQWTRPRLLVALAFPICWIFPAPRTVALEKTRIDALETETLRPERMKVLSGAGAGAGVGVGAGAGVGVGAGSGAGAGTRAKDAVTLRTWDIVTEQVPVPEQPEPLQPVNCEPLAAAAARVTAVPSG